MILTTVIRNSNRNPKNKIASIRFEDKKTKNAFTHEFIKEIQETVKRLNQEEDIAVVILTGFDNVFCSGGNVKEIKNPENTMFDGTPEEISLKYKEGIQKIPLSLNSLEVPIIAAINGYAMGGGFDLALMCDIRIASDQAVFTENFVQLGLISGDGGAWYLPRLIGYSNALRISLTAERVSAVKAKEMGIITEVTPHEALHKEVEKIAEAIAEKSISALKATKCLLKYSQSNTLESSLKKAAELQGVLHHHPAHKVSMEKFMDSFLKMGA